MLQKLLNESWLAQCSFHPSTTL